MTASCLFGCIADDFSGASDAASFLVKGGMQTILCNGIPDSSFDPGEQAVGIVLALKSRTAPVSNAVQDSLGALDWLKEHGAKQIYFKYCSTFDSTPEGNIGPVTDALLEKLQTTATILAPALPINRRKIHDGCLLINGIPLHESPMKNHPLTPMWDCRIGTLMAKQGKYDTLEIHRDELYQSNETIAEQIFKFSQGREHFYIVPDFIDDDDSKRIIELFGDWPLLTGGSGLMENLARKICSKVQKTAVFSASAPGPAMILAGSCATATLGQIRHYKHNGGLTVKLDPDAIMSGNQTLEVLTKEMDQHIGQDVLYYSSEEPDQVKQARSRYGTEISEIIELLIADLAREGIRRGYSRFIIAGGETSGAVAKALNFQSYRIGSSMAPGVPVMIPLINDQVRLVFKSGNFGDHDFFTKVLDKTRQA